jgi:hypothetical protein
LLAFFRVIRAPQVEAVQQEFSVSEAAEAALLN